MLSETSNIKSLLILWKTAHIPKSVQPIYKVLIWYFQFKLIIWYNALICVHYVFTVYFIYFLNTCM